MAVFPKEAWFGLTSQRLRRVALALVSGWVFMVALYRVARTYLYWQTREAADLLERVCAVRIGDPESSLAPLLNKYEDREHEPSCPPRSGSRLELRSLGAAGPILQIAAYAALFFILRSIASTTVRSTFTRAKYLSFASTTVHGA